MGGVMPNLFVSLLRIGSLAVQQHTLCSIWLVTLGPTKINSMRFFIRLRIKQNNNLDYKLDPSKWLYTPYGNFMLPCQSTWSLDNMPPGNLFIQYILPRG